jgi:cell division septation protein DedD
VIPTEPIKLEAKPILAIENPDINKVKSLDGKSLLQGHYVVVGAFRSIENAKSYASTLKKAGYPAEVAFHSEKGYYVVHMGNAATLEESHQLRDKYRQMSRYSFRDTWILTID